MTVDDTFAVAFDDLLDQAGSESGIALGAALEQLRERGFDRPTISTRVKEQILGGRVELTPDRQLRRTPHPV